MATPQYAIAHTGASSIILAKAFSDSSYSKECSSSMARLKSFFTLSSQLISKSTVPNSLPGDPQEINAPLLRSNCVICSFEGFESFPPHEKMIVNNKKNNNDCFIEKFIWKTFEEL